MSDSDCPRSTIRPNSGTTARIALLLDDEANRQELASWLTANTEFTPVVVENVESTAPGDVCIVDLPAFRQHRDWLVESKASERPHWYPVLLVHNEDTCHDESVWAVIDDMIVMPSQLAQLSYRLRNLLERRRDSQQLSDRLDRVEERAERVFEAVNDGILVLDSDADEIIDCNPRAAELLGYSRAELHSLSPCEDLHAGDQEAFRDFVEDVRELGRAKTSQIPYIRKDGSTAEVEVSASVLEETGGSAVVFNLTDIADRREHERSLERHRDELAKQSRITRTLYETIRAVEEASNRESLEANVCQRLSESDSYRFAWIGERAEDGTVVPRASSSEASSYLEQVRVTVDPTVTGERPTGQAFDTATVATVPDVAADPEMKPWQEPLAEFGVRAIAAVPITNEDQMFGVLTLYTDRRSAFSEEEREILDHLGTTIGRVIAGFQAREEVRLFREAVENAGHAIYITEIDGTITYVNSAFEEITGYSSDDAVGKTPKILKSGEHGAEFYRTLWSTLLSGGVWQNKMINRRKDGQRLYVDQTIAPILDAAGNPERFVAVTKDITEQRRRQQQLQVLYRVLRHNLRNKLNIIKGYTNELAVALPADESRNATREITAAVDDLLRISDQARLIEGTSITDDSSWEARPLQDVIQSAIEEVELEPGTEMTLSIPDAEYRVSPQLELAITELLKNAVKHNDACDPELSLTAETTTTGDSSWVTVTITDNGPGIPENERHVLQEGEETPLVHGQGLGLWFVNWIVTELGGGVEIRDNEPRGSTVAFHVPVSE